MHANTPIPNTDCSKGTEEREEQVLNDQHHRIHSKLSCSIQRQKKTNCHKTEIFTCLILFKM